MILCKEYEFEIQENKDSKVLNGVFRDFNSEEQKELKKKNKSFDEAIKSGIELDKKLKRVEKLSLIAENKQDWDKLEELTNEKYKIEDELTALGEKTKPEIKEEEIIKWKFNIALSGKNKDEIISLAETYGYRKVQEAIFEDIIEKKRKKSS